MKGGVIIALFVAGVLLVIACIVLFLFSGIFTKSAYLEPWQKDYYKQFADPRIRLVAHGILAPNGHNMQPWKIRLDPKDNNAFYLFADAERLTPEADPLGRQLMITQGTFLEYVKAAGEKLGYNTEFVFFPEGEYDESDLFTSMQNKPVAKISLTKVKLQNSPLYNYLFKPDTNRAAYQHINLSAEQIRQLQGINKDLDVNNKLIVDHADKVKLGNYALAGAKIESNISRINRETAKIFRPNEYQKNAYRYGFSVEGQGTNGIFKHLIQGIITLYPTINSEENMKELFVNSTQTAVDNTSTYVMIITQGNNRIQQIKSGMAYSRLVLIAHSLGLVLQPLSQVLEEYSEMKDQHDQIHHEFAPNGKTIQMLLRLGEPTKEYLPSMRRDVMELFEV